MEEKLEDVLQCKFNIAMRWIRLLQHGKTITKYIKNKNINSIILYGITEITVNIIDEFDEMGEICRLKAIADKKITKGGISSFYDIPCVSPECIQDYAADDAWIIVTPMGWHREISNELRAMGLKNVITIEELIYDMYSEIEHI